MIKETKQEGFNKKVQKVLNIFQKEMPKEPDFKKRKIYKGNEMCFNTLKEKGLFKNFKNYKHFLKCKELC